MPTSRRCRSRGGAGRGRWAAAGLAGRAPCRTWTCWWPLATERAIAALAGCGYRLVERSPWEDTVLAWGDGSVGRTDGESADHNGKIELHPGWVERLHHYLVDDGGLLLGELATPGEQADGPACASTTPPWPCTCSATWPPP
ncbi:MAG: hypothetical protein R2755_05375 [Acidimicrobiales bacterium]